MGHSIKFLFLHYKYKGLKCPKGCPVSVPRVPMFVYFNIHELVAELWWRTLRCYDYWVLFLFLA